MNPPSTTDHTIATSCTVAIVGGGMAGASLALLLAQQLPSCEIFLLEKQALPSSSAEALSLPSFDARSTALSCSTRDILHSLQLWDVLQPQVTPITSVHVSERQRPAGMLMRASELSQPALGYVVENRHLGQVLLHALQQQPRIHCLEQTETQRVRFTPDHAVLQTSRGEYTADLVVIADGSLSPLRQQLGIACTEVPYQQSALIANVITEQPHHGVAYERFTDSGPVALLPLQAVNGQSRAALVWTVPEQDADALLALPASEFIARVQERFGDRCGRLLEVGSRHSYPLVLRQAQEQVRTRLVLLGNAAHSLHPVAGQGFNLILRDCQALTAVLASACRAGDDPGALSVLQRYVERQLWDQQKTITASDWLPRLFSTRALPQTAIRTAALLGLDFLPGLREWFAREATGISP